MMIEGLRLRLQASPWSCGVQLLIMEETQDGKRSYVKQMVMERVEGVTAVPPSSIIEFDLTVAQTLMDDLWRCGIRPSEGTGSAGSLKATENHLQDMRDIAKKSVDLLIEHAKGIKLHEH